MKRILASLLLLLPLTLATGDERTDAIDFFVLLDTSLSMQVAMPAAKEFVAGEIVGRLMAPGDWAMVMSFYGERKILWKGDITAEADTATLVRSLGSLEADGKFTDIGAALDALDALVLERGHPERPKYLLLVTDERQEAPKGTRYYSADYTMHHTLLQYVKKVDMGSFRIITIGYGLSGRIEDEARSLMLTLAEAPDRPGVLLPGATGGSSDSASDGSQRETGASSRATFPAWLLYGLVALGLIALAIFAAALARSRKREDKDKGKRNA
ncbi:MAG: VWA domain-containing protein [Spirochaetales bacterium]|nr:MAG: VWA domain-containing protein [Spirochaetales bacterium]